MIKFVASPKKMWIICDTHHRDPLIGIHHATANDWQIQRYLFDGYILIARAADEAADIAKDNLIVDADVPIDERA